jgi:hypothetical protein
LSAFEIVLKKKNGLLKNSQKLCKWLLQTLNTILFSQHLFLIYSWERVYSFSLGHKLHHDVTFTCTGQQGSQEKKKESSEDETKSRNT